MNKLKSVYASSYSATVTIVVITAITIVGDLVIPFKNWLAGFTGHHWMTKSYISLIVFAFFYFIFYAIKKIPSDRETQKALLVLQIFTILGFVAILGFYLYEFFAQ